MRVHRLRIVLMVVIGCTEIVGCGGDAARSAPAAHAPVSRTGAISSNGAPPASPLLRPPHRDAPREGVLSTYHNPEEGISFRYPRNYSLEEGELEERSFFLKRQEDLDIEQPGAALLATVLIPEDGFPNTTFEHGSVQVIVNEAGTEKACRETTWAASAGNTVGSTTVQGIVFRWKQAESEPGGTKVLERTYAGYSRGTCYEFLLTVAADRMPDADGVQRPADIGKIMKHLEKIVASAQIFTKSVTPEVESGEETASRL